MNKHRKELYKLYLKNDIGKFINLYEMLGNKNTVIHNLMIKMYKNNKNMDKAISIYNNMDNKLKDNESHGIGIQLYSHFNDIHNCQRIFHSMDNKDNYVYNIMLKTYNDHQMYDETIKLFECENMKSLRDNYSHTIAIQGYSKLNDICNCEKVFHAILNKNGIIYNCMLRAYLDNKKYDKAVQLFESKEMEKWKNNITANIMIQVYSKMNDMENCWKLFDGITNKNEDSFGSMIQAYNDNNMYSESILLFQSMEMRKYRNNICCILAIQSYSKLNDIKNCEYVFNSALHKNDVLYNCLMQAYNDNKMYHEAIKLYWNNQSRINKLKNTISANIVIHAYSKLNDIHNCEKIFGNIKDKNEVTYGAMMQAYNDNNMFSKTIELFTSKEVQNCKNNIICNIAIQAYSQMKDIENCEYLFHEMNNKSEAIYGSIMQAYNDNKKHFKVIQLFQSKELECLKNITICNIAIQAYSHLNEMDNCEIIFNQMENKDIVSYSVMMNGYRLNGKYQQLFDMFDKLWRSQNKLGSQIFCNALYACGDIVSLDKGRNVIHRLNQKYNRHLLYDGHVLAAIISFMIKCISDSNKVRSIYDIIITKTAIIDNVDVVHVSMMDCYTKSGKVDQVLELFYQLKRMNHKITNKMYSIVLNSCAHAGYTSTALDVFNECLNQNNHVITDTHLLTPIIDCFGRNNELNEAEYYYHKTIL